MTKDNDELMPCPIQEYVDNYEMCGEDTNSYTPTDHERALILDAMMGYEPPRPTPTQPSADVCEILEHLEYCIDNHTTSEDEDMAFRGIKKLRADLTQPKGHVDGRTHYDLLSHACTMADELAHLQKNTTEKDRVIDFDLISEKLCKLYQMARHNPEASKLYGAISLELDKLGGE